MHGVVAQPRGNNLAQLLLGQDTVIHQDLPDQPVLPGAALLLLGMQAVLQGRRGQHAGVDQRLTQVPRLADGGMGGGELFPQGFRIGRAESVGGEGGGNSGVGHQGSEAGIVKG